LNRMRLLQIKSPLAGRQSRTFNCTSRWPLN
jgi:hypothetical protein